MGATWYANDVLLLDVVLLKWLHETGKISENHFNYAYHLDKKEWHDGDFPELIELRRKNKVSTTVFSTYSQIKLNLKICLLFLRYFRHYKSKIC